MADRIKLNAEAIEENVEYRDLWFDAVFQSQTEEILESPDSKNKQNSVSFNEPISQDMNQNVFENPSEIPDFPMDPPDSIEEAKEGPKSKYERAVNYMQVSIIS